MKMDRECTKTKEKLKTETEMQRRCQIQSEQAHAVKIYDLKDTAMPEKEVGTAMPWMVWN